MKKYLNLKKLVPILTLLLIVVACNKQDVESDSTQSIEKYDDRYDLSLSSLTSSLDLLQQNKGHFSGDGFSLDRVNGVVRGKSKISKYTYLPALDIQGTGILWIDGATLQSGSISLRSFGKIILTNGARIRVSSISTFAKSKIAIYDDFKKDEHLELSKKSLKTNLGKNMLTVRGDWQDYGSVITFFDSDKNNVYTITYNTDGGTVIDNKTVLGGETLTKPTDPTKENYTFVDWYTDKERTTVFDFESPITSDMTLYAKWKGESLREIPDANFRAYLKEKLPNAFEGDLLKVKHESVTTLTQIIVSAKNISSLEGVQYFTALTKLWCYNNQLTTLDVSQNVALKELYCGLNQLMTLDVSQNVALKELYCDTNQITTLDVSQSAALKELYCNNNQLTTLDVSQNKALEFLYCHNNQLTSLDISKNTSLEELWCKNNQLTTLDVSQNVALTYLYCAENQLTTLDVSQNKALTKLWCHNNQLTTLDVSQNVALKELYCDTNQITTLDVSQNTALTRLVCSYNQLTTLDVGQNVALKELSCNYNQLTSLDISKNTSLEELWCKNNQLTTLDVSQNVALTYLYCAENQLTTLDVSQNVALTGLWCYNNQLTTLDVSQNKALEFLYCHNNQLTTLDIRSNKNLETLIINSDFGTNPKLSQILVHEDKVCDAGVTLGGGIKEIFNTNKGKGLDMHIKTYDDAGTETNDYDEAGYAVACP